MIVVHEYDIRENIVAGESEQNRSIVIIALYHISDDPPSSDSRESIFYYYNIYRLHS